MKLAQSSLLLLVFFFALIFTAVPSMAVTRAILIPGRTAILIMEGMSSSGADLEPRHLYDAIAMAPLHQAGGEGKVLKTSGKDFNLVCATKNFSQISVVCNIVIKASSRATVGGSAAEFHLGGPEAKDFFEKLAGLNAVSPFHFETANHQMRIESSIESFDFYFHQ